MKHIINYLSALIAVVLIGSVFTACADDDAQSANVGLGIKTFFPTKVVTNQPMTINGSGFDAVTEIEFPGGVKATGFELVGNDMIRVNAPAGIASEGGNIIVRTSTEQAESRVPLTIGNTNVTGFDKQPGDEITGGDQITVYGSDLEFVNSIELLDAEGNPQLIDHKDFYRKGTNNLIFRVPTKNIFEGTWVGTVHTYDGKSFSMPELAYKPAADDGHWETVKNVIWTNSDPDGNGAISWNGTYRFTYEGNDGNNECIATFPAEIWEKLKSEKFYLRYKPAGDSYQVRVTTGWWGTQWLGKDNDIAPWNMADRIIDNEDGTFSIEVDFAEDPAILETIDAQHLLFTGNGYTPLELYFQEEMWVGPNNNPSEYDIAPFTMYQDQSDFVQYPFYPSWGDDKGKWRIMRGGNPAIESLGLTTNSKFVVYKEVGTTGQIQWNNPNWTSFEGVSCNDWDGSAETIEVPVTEDMLKCINGEITDGWSNTAIILQGDGLTVTKIVIVP